MENEKESSLMSAGAKRVKKKHPVFLCAFLI